MTAGRPTARSDARTEAAVKAMQTALAQVSDGVYGPQSAAALGAFLQQPT